MTTSSDEERQEAKLIYNRYEVRQVEIITTDNCRVFVRTASLAKYPSELYYVKEGREESKNDLDLIPRWHMYWPRDSVIINHVQGEGIAIKHIIAVKNKDPNFQPLPARELFIPFTMIKHTIVHRVGHMYWMEP